MQSEPHHHGKVKRPQIKAQVLLTGYHIGHLGQIAAREQRQKQRAEQHHGDALENHQEGQGESDVGTLFHHREEEWDNQRGDHIGNDGVNGERGDASSQFFGNHGSCSSRWADDTDENSFKDDLRLHIIHTEDNAHQEG